MPFSSGTFSLFTPGNPTGSGTTISSTWANNTLTDVATGLSTCMLKDGTQPVTANIPMAGFKFTGLGAGTASGNSIRYEQVNGIVTTAGDLIYASGAGTFARLAVGTADLPLVVNAGATAPQWGFANKTANTVYAGPTSGGAASPTFRSLVLADTTAAIGAGLALIATNTPSAAATSDFTSGVTGFDAYLVELVNVVPATNAVDLDMQMSINAGGAWQTAAASYAYQVASTGANATDYSTSSASATGILLTGGTNTVSNTAASGGITGTILCFLGSATQSKFIISTIAYAGSVAYARVNGFGVGQSAAIQGAAVNGLRFLFGAGNIASGTIRLYGIRNS